MLCFKYRFRINYKSQFDALVGKIEMLPLCPGVSNCIFLIEYASSRDRVKFSWLLFVRELFSVSVKWQTIKMNFRVKSEDVF